MFLLSVVVVSVHLMIDYSVNESILHIRKSFWTQKNLFYVCKKIFIETLIIREIQYENSKKNHSLD